MDILSLPIEVDKKKIGSRYRLVIIAAQRARELSLGASPRVQAKAKKVSTTALLEILSGKIEFLTGDEAISAREKAEKIDYRKLLEEKKRPIADLSDLEKDLKIYLHEKGAEEKALEEIFAESEGAKEEAAEQE